MVGRCERGRAPKPRPGIPWGVKSVVSPTGQSQDTVGSDSLRDSPSPGSCWCWSGGRGRGHTGDGGLWWWCRVCREGGQGQVQAGEFLAPQLRGGLKSGWK